MAPGSRQHFIPMEAAGFLGYRSSHKSCPFPLCCRAVGNVACSYTTIPERSSQNSAAAECGRQTSFYAMWHICIELSHAQMMYLSLLKGSLPLDAHRFQILPLPSAVWLLLRVVSLGLTVSCSLCFWRRDSARERESEQEDRREKVRTWKRKRELERDTSWALPGQPTLLLLLTGLFHPGSTWSLWSPYLPASRAIL